MLRKLRQIDYFAITVFAMSLIDIGDLKYVFAWAFIGLYLLYGMLHERPLSNHGAEKSFLTILCSLLILFAITALRQVRGEFNSYAINEAIYFLTPLLFVWVYISRTDKDTIGTVLDYFFAICVIKLIVDMLPNLTIQNLMQISFADSYSVFESGLALFFMYFEWLYLQTNRKRKALLAMVLCIFCFKRFCMVIAVLVLIFQNVLVGQKPVSKRMVIGVTCVFVLLPVLTCYALENGASEWFYDKFGTSLDLVTMNRSSRIEAAIKAEEAHNGLGSVTTFMTKMLNEMHGSNTEQRNLHNDLVRIYLECGLLGVVVFVYGFLKAASANKTLLLFMCYLLLESYLNPVFAAGTTDNWICAYLVIAYITMEQECAVNTEHGPLPKTAAASE